jgi:hypothetical protein
MTILKIIDGNKSREVNLTSVEKIRNNLERILSKRKNFLDRSHVEYSIEIMEEAKKLNKEQLEYLVNSFLHLMFKYADLYQSALDNPKKFCKRAKEYKELFELKIITQSNYLQEESLHKLKI